MWGILRFRFMPEIKMALEAKGIEFKIHGKGGPLDTKGHGVFLDIKEADFHKVKGTGFFGRFAKDMGSFFGKRANGILGVSVGAGILAAGGSGEEAYAAAVPYGGAQVEAAKAGEAAVVGDNKSAGEHGKEAGKQAAIETAAIGGSIAAGTQIVASASTIVESAGAFFSALRVAKNFLYVSGAGVLAALGMEAGFDIVSEFMKLPPEERLKETQALQDNLIGNEKSPLPKTITIQGKSMPMDEALKNHFTDVQEAMKDSPQALEVMTSWKALEEYKKKWQEKRPETTVRAEAPEPERRTPEAAPAPS